MTRILSKYLVAAAVVAGVAGALPATAVASTISFSPSFQAIGLPGSASVDVVISGLADDQAVGSFDLDITFLNTVVGYTGYTLGSGLGTGFDVDDLSLELLPGGAIDIAAVSYLDPAALKPLQGNSFVLFTLTFDAVANGLSPLAFTQTIFADQDGIEFAPQLSTGAIQVGAVSVPEPASMMIYGLAGAMIAVVQRRFRPRQAR